MRVFGCVSKRTSERVSECMDSMCEAYDKENGIPKAVLRWKQTEEKEAQKQKSMREK